MHFHIRRNLINLPAVLGLLLITVSCIKSYEPELKSGETQKYVVSGRVTDQEGFQYVSVSLSSSVEEPVYIPISGCWGMISDDRGHSFYLEQLQDGKYRTWIDQQYLSPGTSYRLSLITPDQIELESDYDLMPECPEIGDVYYERKDIATTDPSQPEKGIQLYIDLDASAVPTQYFQWDLEETWEYHVSYAKEYYYAGEIFEINPPDSSTFACWMTQPVMEVFTLSTINISGNIYKKFPLQFIDNHSQRLRFIYSLLVNQLAVSQEAYTYWDQLRMNSELGGLYDHQPLDVRGNIHNLSDPNKEVLGFFQASAMRTKRIFIKDVPLELDYETYCWPNPLTEFGWGDWPPFTWPVYFTLTEQDAVRTLNNYCIDCMLWGGINVKPDFWPEE